MESRYRFLFRIGINVALIVGAYQSGGILLHAKETTLNLIPRPKSVRLTGGELVLTTSTLETSRARRSTGWGSKKCSNSWSKNRRASIKSSC